MTEYIFNTIQGTLLPVSENEEPSPHRANKSVSVLSKAEFSDRAADYPHGLELIKDMENLRYSRIDSRCDCLLGTIKTPVIPFAENDSYIFGFYLSKDLLIFIPPTDEAGQNLLFLLEKFNDYAVGKSSILRFLLIILEHLIEKDSILLQNIEDQLSAMEDGLLKSIPQNLYEDIIRYRKLLSSLHSYYDQLTDIGEQMEENISGMLSAEECSCWQMYTKRTERLHNHTERLIEYLLQIRELYQSQLAAQQNKVITFLTVVTTIFLPLTLIAGWYGMNFSNMLAFKWEYGYIAVVILSVLLIIAEIVYFKKRKML